MKTLAFAAHWMFINVVPPKKDVDLVDTVEGKTVNLKLTHEGFGALPVVAGQFGQADIRITLNPPFIFHSKEIIILVNPAEGEFTNIRVEMNEAALMEALVNLIQSEKV